MRDFFRALTASSGGGGGGGRARAPQAPLRSGTEKTGVTLFLETH